MKSYNIFSFTGYAKSILSFVLHFSKRYMDPFQTKQRTYIQNYINTTILHPSVMYWKYQYFFPEHYTQTLHGFYTQFFPCKSHVGYLCHALEKSHKTFVHFIQIYTRTSHTFHAREIIPYSTNEWGILRYLFYFQDITIFITHITTRFFSLIFSHTFLTFITPEYPQDNSFSFICATFVRPYLWFVLRPLFDLSYPIYVIIHWKK